LRLGYFGKKEKRNRRIAEAVLGNQGGIEKKRERSFFNPFSHPLPPNKNHVLKKLRRGKDREEGKKKKKIEHPIRSPTLVF